MRTKQAASYNTAAGGSLSVEQKQGTNLLIQQNIIKNNFVEFFCQSCLAPLQISGHPGSIGQGRLLLEMLVDHFCKFTTIAQAHFLDRKDCRLKVLWLGWCPGFSFGSLLSTLQHQRDQNIGIRLYTDISWTSLHLINLWMLSSAVGSWCQFVEGMPLSWIQPCLSRNFLWPATQLNRSPSPHWKLCLTTKDSQFKLHILPYQESSLRVPSQIPGGFQCIRFLYGPPNIPQFQPSLSELPPSHSPNPLMPTTPVPTNLQTTQKIYSMFPFLEVHTVSPRTFLFT